ncbi:asparagine synthase (glutamine-hydrolyzing) [Nocardia sp. NPDC058058]|uniref:asparagine synthase (glutamine-hydrolyzing) n=1 Tax=Nocardia sp. NPDC058058 TaxID=3346317 RepID=UPI0036DC27CA
MCGITGFIDWTGSIATGAEIRAMTGTLRHRGPDADGVWVDKHAAIGHARLSIIDDVGGSQPMTIHRDDLPIVLTFSGEIYNFADLRRQLTGLGHRFVTRSDTEVVLQSYLRWGPGCVERFNGMFAFAIWDGTESRLLLARDRLGIKPLYYAHTPKGLVFGSELKALLAHHEITAEVDADGLAELIAMVPMTSPGHAIFRGIHELEPATVLTATAEGFRTHRYWELQDHPHEHDFNSTVSRIRELLTDSVIAQTGADVPVCTLNSGGLDSAAATALAAAHLRTTGKTLMSFDIDHAYESIGSVAHAASALHVDRDNSYALLTAKHVGTQHHTFVVTTQDLLDARELMLTAFDLPSLSTINTSLALLFRRISQDAPVAISGEGADELFHGYRWHHDTEDQAVDDFPWHRTYRPISTLLNGDARRHIDPLRYRRERYQVALENATAAVGFGKDRRVRQIAALTNSFYLPFLLRRADRASMASGVELRVPYLDHRLVEYTWNIPDAWRRDRGMEKGLLRRSVSDLLPDEIVWRRKSGYPASITLGYHRALWARANDTLADPSSPLHQLIDATSVSQYLARHSDDLADWTPTQHISYLLEIDAWFRTYNVRLR